MKIRTAEKAVTKKRDPRKDWDLYLFLLLPIIYIIVFKYLPMGGLVVAFKNYKGALGIWKSQWVGFKHFKDFFEDMPKEHQSRRLDSEIYPRRSC